MISEASWAWYMVGELDYSVSTKKCLIQVCMTLKLGNGLELWVNKVRLL